jgi:hypothetical protein
VPRGRSGRRRVGAVHRSDLSGVDGATVDDVPCTTVARALVESAALVDRATMCDLVDEAFVTRHATRDAVVAAAARAGRLHGKALLADVLDAWRPEIRPESPAEARLLRRLVELGLPAPESQYTIATAGGSTIRFDVAWPAYRVALEYDGRRWHGPRQWEHDERRHEAARALGWLVLHVDATFLLPGDDRLRDLVAPQLLSRCGTFLVPDRDTCAAARSQTTVGPGVGWLRDTA